MLIPGLFFSQLNLVFTAGAVDKEVGVVYGLDTRL